MIDNPLGVKQGDKILVWDTWEADAKERGFCFYEKTIEFKWIVFSNEGRSIHEYRCAKLPEKEKTVEDEVKACEWFRDGWRFCSLKTWESDDKPYFNLGHPMDDRSFDGRERGFVAYVVRLGDGKISDAYSPNWWTNDEGGSQPLPSYFDDSYKAELLGVIVEGGE